ncbi:MAG: hypothetical protein ACKOA6_01625, partial [Actinomycetota bacterium]
MIRRLSPPDAIHRRWTSLVLPAALAATAAVVPAAPAAGTSRSLPTISTTTLRTAPLVRLGDRG